LAQGSSSSQRLCFFRLRPTICFFFVSFDAIQMVKRNNRHKHVRGQSAKGMSGKRTKQPKTMVRSKVLKASGVVKASLAKAVRAESLSKGIKQKLCAMEVDGSQRAAVAREAFAGLSKNAKKRRRKREAKEAAQAAAAAEDAGVAELRTAAPMGALAPSAPMVASAALAPSSVLTPAAVAPATGLFDAASTPTLPSVSKKVRRAEFFKKRKEAAAATAATSAPTAGEDRDDALMGEEEEERTRKMRRKEANRAIKLRKIALVKRR